MRFGGSRGTEKIAIGFDHAGVGLKPAVIKILRDLNIPYEDCGTQSAESVDYPDFAVAVAGKVSRGEVSGGILACGTGIGMAMVANKFKGVRAAVALEESSARLAKEHNNANILCLGGRLLKEEAVGCILTTWLQADFKGERHGRRLDKIRDLESRNMK